MLLYDTVTVRNEEINLSLQLYVSEWEWDAIRQKITALKLVNTTDYKKGSVTGYNVQSKSISSEKLMDEVKDEIVGQVVDIIPEYADPTASRPATVTVTDGDPTLSWGTRSKVGTVQGTDMHVTMPANPAPEVYDGLDSTSTTKALSANQGRILKEMLTNLSYSLTGISAGTNVTIEAGGIFIVGKIVFVNIRFKATAQLSTSTDIIKGRPLEVNGGSSYVAFASGNKDYQFYLNNQTGNIRSSPGVESGKSISIMGHYLKA